MLKPTFTDESRPVRQPPVSTWRGEPFPDTDARPEPKPAGKRPKRVVVRP